MQDPYWISQAIATIIPILFAITVHEVAHGWVAFQFGDPTASRLGRLTLNPIKHIDPIGTVLVPGILFMTGGIIFGWAKPVPIDYRRLKNPKKSMMLVAAAGPFSNLIMAFAWAIIFKSADVWAGDLTAMMQLMGFTGLWINIVLMVLNLLPIPPLDGSQILAQVLPEPYKGQYEQLMPYGMFILIALALSGILFAIIFPIIQQVVQLIMTILNIQM